MLFVLVACANNSNNSSKSDGPPKVASLFSIPDPRNAGGWDRAQMAGLDVLSNDFGWEVNIAESVPYPRISEIVLGFVDQGYDIVIYPDAGMMESYMELPADNPDTLFIMCSIIDEIPQVPNAAAYAPDFHEYGMLVGLAMGRASQTNKIGIIGGAPIPVLQRVFSGVIEGAKVANPNIEATVLWAGDWTDTAKHREISMLLTNEGCDMLFTVTGPADKGVYEVAEATGALVVGYTWDMYNDNPNAFLTSLIVNTPSFYKQLAEDFLAGKIKNEIVSLDRQYFYFADFRGSVPKDVEDDIRELARKFLAGEISVPNTIHEDIMN